MMIRSYTQYLQFLQMKTFSKYSVKPQSFWITIFHWVLAQLCHEFAVMDSINN